MIATAHIPKKDDKIMWGDASGSLYLGVFVVLYSFFWIGYRIAKVVT